VIEESATYLGFLLQTIGMSVNPAIMREPKMFASVVTRLDRWEIVPSRDAFYPEFPASTKLKLPPEKWPETAAIIRKNFMSVFGRQARLLNDREYFEAFRFVQSMNLGEVSSTPENRARFEKSMAAMEAAEKRLFPEPEPTVGKPQAPKPGVVRAGQGVPVPKVLRRVEPEFPPGEKGSVIMEVTIGPDGTVTDVNVLRGMLALDAAAIKAVRQWLFEVSRIDGRPVSVLYTATVTTR
jgi:TonB family protein